MIFYCKFILILLLLVVQYVEFIFTKNKAVDICYIKKKKIVICNILKLPNEGIQNTGW